MLAFLSTPKCRLCPPRPFPWTMKSLESAKTGIQTLPDGRMELTIRHDIIHGVTPTMLGWWFRNIDGVMEYEGRTYPRYHVWHPVDHIHYEVARRASDGTAGAGARFLIVEALGGDTHFLINSVADVPKNDDAGITLSVRKLGMEVMRLEHTFAAVPQGTLYESRMRVGAATSPGRLLINPFIRRRLFTEAKARAWLKHNIEEVGNFEFFLPELYAAQGG